MLSAIISTAMLLGVVASASAYTYDYRMGSTGGNWNTRAVAHNYHFIRDSAFAYVCVKLTRTSNGLNYGDVTCGDYQTGRHYAGDTGTYSWGKAQGVDNQYILDYHEEW